MKKILFFLCAALAVWSCAPRCEAQWAAVLAGSPPVGAYDSDAQAYFNAVTTAAGVDTLSAPEKGYVNTFVLAAKSHAYWTKLKLIFIFCSSQGTATQNLTGSLVPLYAGGGALTSAVNHGFVNADYSAATGLTGNGTSKYLDTGFNPSTSLTANNTHFAIYNRSSTADGGRSGAGDGSGSFTAYMPYADGVFYDDMYDGTVGQGRLASPSAIGTPYGFLLGTRRASNDHQIYRNGTSLNSNATSGGTMPSLNIYIFAINALGSPSGYTNANLSGASIGTGLTGTDVTNFSTDFNALETSLGRNTY